MPEPTTPAENPLDALQPGTSDGMTVLEWIKRRVEKVRIPGAIDEWPAEWARAYAEDVPLLVEEVERLRGALSALEAATDATNPWARSTRLPVTPSEPPRA